ncbi:reverse transcriptase domain-containing protein, partial [Tanacetum coccineum]
MVAIFHDMIKKTMEVFMDDFSVFGDSFSTCLTHLEKMLKRCEDTNLSLNWEKSHFMVKEGIVLGHKISKSIEVDKSKVDVIAKLPHPTTVKGIRSFLDDVSKAPILVAPDWDLPFEIMCDASDFAVGAVLGQQLLAVVYAFEKFRPYLVLSKSIVYTEEHVIIKNLTTHDDFLNRLCFTGGLFRGDVPKQGSSLPNIPEDDPDGSTLEPVLSMRYNDPEQLKLVLCNYKVAHGYQLWFMKNDWKSLLVFCGRDIQKGRCARKKGNKNRVLNKNRKKKADTGETSKKIKLGKNEGSKVRSKKKVGNNKKVTFKEKKDKESGVGSSKPPVCSPHSSPGKKWTKKATKEDKKPYCPFRLYASWMSSENSFQIKSLISDHKFSRNYNLGSLVNYRWIACQCVDQIIKDPFIPLRTMKEDIRQKFMIDEYRQALIDSNPGTTCRLDVEDTSSGKAFFKRMCICFKRVKDGWDANNQMYPIAWAVVRVENLENWCWFLSLLHDDLNLNNGNGLTIISNSHKISYHKQSIKSVPDMFMPTLRRGLVVCSSKGCFRVQLQRTLVQQFEQRIAQLRLLDDSTYDYLIEKNPNSWSRSFSEMDRRDWLVYPSGFQELEVRKGDESYGVDLMNKVCGCRMWELSGVPCVHAMAGYLHLNKDPDNEVSYWFSQDMWFNAYQFSIIPVPGTNLWKRNEHQPPLPSIVRRMPGRPQKERIKSAIEESTQQVGVGSGTIVGRGRGRGITSTSFAHLSKQVLVEELKEKSINAAEVLAVVEEEGDTWMTPIFKYLSDGTLLAEGKKARAAKRKSWRFLKINGILYKKSFLGPWLRCMGPLQANYVLREIHEGSCNMHADTRSVVAKALRIVHKPVPRNPQQRLSPITSLWPFYKWGIDIAGPFPEGPKKVKFLIVAIDYFTKWIEAKPVATITGSQIKKFMWDNIVCRFGLPGEIISDNGKQFQANPFKDWCEKLCILETDIHKRTKNKAKSKPNQSR